MKAVACCLCSEELEQIFSKRLGSSAASAPLAPMSAEQFEVVRAALAAKYPEVTEPVALSRERRSNDSESAEAGAGTVADAEGRVADAWLEGWESGVGELLGGNTRFQALRGGLPDLAPQEPPAEAASGSGGDEL